MPNVLLHFSVEEIHNSPVILPEEGGLKEERDAYNNIIINYSTLRQILTPQIKTITS